MNAIQYAGINAARNLKSKNLFHHQGHDWSAGDRQSAAVVHSKDKVARSVYVVDLQSNDICEFSSSQWHRDSSAKIGFIARVARKPQQISSLSHRENVDLSNLQSLILRNEVDLARVTNKHRFIDREVGQFPTARESEHSRATVVDDILALAPGWDGTGSIAPTSEAKRVIVSVAAHLSTYLNTAEVEVDPSDGGISLRWMDGKSRSILSVDVRPSGKIIVAGTTADGASLRKTLASTDVERVLRVAVDAGISHIDDRLR